MVGIPVALVGRRLPQIGKSVPLVGLSVALVGLPLAFVSFGLALVGQAFTFIWALVASCLGLVTFLCRLLSSGTLTRTCGRIAVTSDIAGVAFNVGLLAQSLRNRTLQGCAPTELGHDPYDLLPPFPNSARSVTRVCAHATTLSRRSTSDTPHVGRGTGAVTRGGSEVCFVVWLSGAARQLPSTGVR
jgi:hypothetical protein